MTSTRQHQASISAKGVRAASGALALVTVLIPALVATRSAQAQTYSVLYSFTGGADGGYPYAALVRDTAGNLYGTTSGGGSASGFSGNGVVFKIDTTGTETVLHTFAGYPADGKYPYAGLILAGTSLYGTTEFGGASDAGVVFKVKTSGAETVLYSFNYTDGGYPFAGLVRDPAGNLYGTTPEGGASGNGVVFKLDTTGTETVLYSFAGYPTDGASPLAGLVRDTAGNLYGTTYDGGAFGDGVVFKLDTTGTETILYTFTGSKDGGNPRGALLRNTAGTLWGTTYLGGTSPCDQGCGVVFKLGTTAHETVLLSFDGTDGELPFAGLMRDPAGNLYGTTFEGGASGCGVVFELGTTGTETVLHSFDYTDGCDPSGGLVRDTAGNLYGTTNFGGASGYGVVFKLTP